MNGVFLALWMLAALVISLTLMATVNPLAGLLCLTANGVVLRIVQSSLNGPPKPMPPQAQSNETSLEGRAELYVSRMGFESTDDKGGVALFIDGSELGAINDQQTKLYLRAGSHVIQARHFIKPPTSMMGGKIWSKVMESVVKIESKPLSLMVKDGARIEIVCKREQEGFSTPRLILFVKEENNQPEPVAPTMKQCPKCAEDIKAAAVVCRYCGHQFAESA